MTDNQTAGPVHRSHYPTQGEEKAAAQLHIEGDTVWLKGNSQRPHMRVTIVECSKNPGTGACSYQVKDSNGDLVESGQWFPQRELTRKKNIQPAVVSLESGSPAATAEHTRWQSLWDGRMQNGTSLQRPYKKTAVLLISFEDTDLANLHEEVSDLERVFVEDYGFRVEEARLKSNEEGEAQREVKFHLSRFLLDHDRKDTLLIIYYAGHGWVPDNDQKDYKMHGKPSQATNRFNFVEWHDAEHLLTSTLADVFAIFDSCNAGHLCQPRGVVRYEILGACVAGELTDPPGESSFTSALIWALKELKAEQKGSFGTPELLLKITKAPRLPKSQQPLLAHRTIPSLDHIIISPYDKDDMVDNILALSPAREVESKVLEYIDIRLHFSESITDDHIERTAGILREIISRKPEKDLAIDRISYLGRLKAQQHALWWLQSYRAKKSSSSSTQQIKSKPLSPPLLEIPVSILAPTNATLEVPLSAISKESGSSNAATMCDGDAPESTEPMFVSSPESIDEQADQALPFPSGSAEVVANSSGTHNLVMKAQILDGAGTGVRALSDLLATNPSHHLKPSKDNDSGKPSRKVGNGKNRSISRLAASVFGSLKRKASRVKRVETRLDNN